MSVQAEPVNNTLKEGDLRDEKYRVYDFGGRVYTIESPVKVYFTSKGSTHRVVDAEGMVHCVPAPGVNGCVLRWQPLNPDKPVAW